MGMHGNGRRQTNSPGSSGGLSEPVGVKLSMAIPNMRHWISPRYTGSAVDMPANKEQMSVPPVLELEYPNKTDARLTSNGTQNDVRFNMLIHIVEKRRRKGRTSRVNLS